MAGRKAVRQAIQQYLQTAQVPYIGTVYPARPTILQEEDYAQTLSGQAVAASTNGSNCVVVVNLTKDDRQRKADVGRAAVEDTNIHLVVLELFFACSSGTAVQAQLDYDTVVDGLIVAIRANPTPGGGTTIWSAGEYDYGVKHQQGEPYSPDTGLTVLINGTIRFQAWEWIAGSNV